MHKTFLALALSAAAASPAAAKDLPTLMEAVAAFRSAYGEDAGASSWTATVHLGIRYKQGVAISPRVPSDTVLTGFASQDACVSAGQLVVFQKTYGPSVHSAEGAILCLDTGTDNSSFIEVLE